MAIRATITYVKVEAIDFRLVAESPHRWFTDTVTLSEITLLSTGKGIPDSFTFTDTTALHPSKVLTGDSVTMSDTVVKLVSYNLPITDAFTLDDSAQIDKDTYKNKTNHAFMTDEALFALSKSLPDGITIGDSLGILFERPVTGDSISFTDSEVKSLGKNITTDSVTFTDTDNYNLSKVEGDSFTMGESHGKTIATVLASAFTLDDSALIDKDYYGVKGNVFSFSDNVVVSRTFGRALGNPMLNTYTLN